MEGEGGGRGARRAVVGAEGVEGGRVVVGREEGEWLVRTSWTMSLRRVEEEGKGRERGLVRSSSTRSWPLSSLQSDSLPLSHSSHTCESGR